MEFLICISCISDLTAWLQENWIDLAQTAVIIVALWVAAKQLYLNNAINKYRVHMDIVKSHREIWSQIILDENLSRIAEETLDLTKSPITKPEKKFTIFLILHVSTLFSASKRRFLSISEEDKEDIKGLFALPIVKKVWSEIKDLYSNKFVKFIADLNSTGKGKNT